MPLIAPYPTPLPFWVTVGGPLFHFSKSGTHLDRPTSTTLEKVAYLDEMVDLSTTFSKCGRHLGKSGRLLYHVLKNGWNLDEMVDFLQIFEKL